MESDGYSSIAVIVNAMTIPKKIQKIPGLIHSFIDSFIGT